MSDMKEEIDEIACDIAFEFFNREPEDIPQQSRDWCYTKATQEWHDRQAAKAEQLEDR